MPILILLLAFCSLPLAAFAGFDEGLVAYQRGDGKSAASHLLPLGKKGQAEAQYYLGRLYYYQIEGVRQDYQVSAKWFRRAAEQGHALARYKLGGMYVSGRGVKPDDRQAVYWWRLAAGQGSHEAQNNLGAMFANGRGVPQSLVLAYAIQSLALANGNELAEENLRNKEGLMSPSEIEEAKALAQELGQPGMFARVLDRFLADRLELKNSPQPR